MTVLARNWRCGRAGEIDIVARDGDALVVCEVKTRRAGGFEHPMAAVTPDEGASGCAARRALAGASTADRRPAGCASTSSAWCCPDAARPLVEHARGVA